MKEKYDNNLNLTCYTQDLLGYILHAIYTGLVRSNVKKASVIHVLSNHNYMHPPNCYLSSVQNVREDIFTRLLKSLAAFILCIM